MSIQPKIILGAGGHAAVVADAISLIDGCTQHVFVYDDNLNLAGKTLLDIS